ncbi:MAG: hypothetical protein K2K57_07295 [Oscillospiraceae bacterium]|nr:hypothetical protein [Oscillospiraceae bacterium]
MGKCILGSIIFEDTMIVEYSYGIDDSMQGRLVIDKMPFSVQKIESNKIFAPESAAFELAAKIKKYYNEKGIYPNTISKQS